MPTLRVVSTFTIPFRGEQEEWSLGHNFQAGTNPITEAFVSDVANALWSDVYKPIFASNVHWVRAHGGVLGEPALWSGELTTPDAGLVTPQPQHPEICVLAESKIGRRNYLRKWLHTGRAMPVDSDSPDAAQASMISAINPRLLKLTDGSLPGAVQYCRPNGALTDVPFTCDPWLRSRQFRRRGKRPPTTSG